MEMACGSRLSVHTASARGERPPRPASGQSGDGSDTRHADTDSGTHTTQLTGGRAQGRAKGRATTRVPLVP